MFYSSYCGCCGKGCGGIFTLRSVYQCNNKVCKIIVCSDCARGWVCKNCPECGNSMRFVSA